LLAILVDRFYFARVLKRVEFEGRDDEEMD
jgi:hypothetical protein